MSFFNDNGILRPANALVHGVESPAALYGDGLFETIRFVDGKMPLWERHWARLSAGCAALLLTLPEIWNAEFFAEEICRTVEKAERSNAHRVRLQLYATIDGKTRYAISCAPLPTSPNLVALGISTNAIKDPGLHSQFKTSNALPYRIALREAAAAGWDDAVLLNRSGIIVETTKCNILLSLGGIVFVNTPADGCIAGVMLAQLTEWMQEWGFPVRQSSLTLEMLFAADEIFLTNALRGVMTVQGLFSHKQFGERSLSTSLGRTLSGMVEQKFIAQER